MQAVSGKAVKKEQTVVKEEQQKTELFTVELGASPPQAQRFAHGRVLEKAPLQKGLDGFLMATFADGTQKAFDVPNLVLETLVKKRAEATEAPVDGAVPKSMKARAKAKGKGKKAKKKKALKGTGGKTKAAAPPAPPAVAAAAPVPSPVGSRYGIMYYKNNNAIGIRAKTGLKNQVLAFGGMGCTKGEVALKAVGRTVANMLDNGISTSDAKAEGQRLANEE